MTSFGRKSEINEIKPGKSVTVSPEMNRLHYKLKEITGIIYNIGTK